MFIFFKNNGLFISGNLGINYFKYLPYTNLYLIQDQTLNLKNNNFSYFSNLKRDLYIFKNNIINSYRILELGYFLEILINGIGYKCWRFNTNDLLFNLGYSHFIKYKNEFNIFFRITKYSIKFFSINKFLLGLMVSEIIKLRKPDLYKGKGLRLYNQKLNLKVGKQR